MSVSLSSSTSDPEALEKIKKEISCAMCLELYEGPKTLPACLHTFCESCLVKAEAARRRQRKDEAGQPAEQIECPQCRSLSAVPGGVGGITTNFMYANIIQHIQIRDKDREEGQMRCGNCREDVEAPAVAFCYDCSVALCDYCREMHTRTRELSSHNFKSLEDIQKPGDVAVIPMKRHYPCPKHADENLKLYCFQCDVVICRDCTLMDHKDHPLNFINQIVASERVSLNDVVSPLHENLAQLEEARGDVEKALEGLEKSGKERLAEINTAFDRCVSEVQERRQHFLECSRGATEVKLKTVGHQREEIESTLSQLSSMLEFTSNVIKTASDVEVFMYKKEILSRVESLRKLHEQTPVQVHEEDRAAFVIETQCVRELGAIVEVPCPVTSFAEGLDGIKPLQSEESTITVLAHDSQGHTLVHGGVKCTAQLSCIPAMVGEKFTQKAQVSDNSDGSYTVGFVPKYPGKASLEVFFAETAINGSPFEVDVMRNYTDVMLEPFVFDLPNASPWGLAMLSNKQVAVTASDCMVHIYTTQGEEVDTIRSNFTRPYGIWSDADDSLWITDREAHNIQKFSRTSNGKFEKVFQFGLRGVNPGQFSHPRGITLHPSTGNIYISDMKNNRIQIFRQDSPVPKYKGQFGGPGKSPSLFNLPAGLCFDRRDQLLVCDDHNCRVQVFNPEGRFIHTLGTTPTQKGLLCSPIGVSCDPHGRYIITEFGSHTVTFMSPEGKILSCVRYLGDECGQFVHPRGVTCDAVGYVYVADNENMRIVRF